jgi:hypothetical protein
VRGRVRASATAGGATRRALRGALPCLFLFVLLSSGRTASGDRPPDDLDARITRFSVARSMKPEREYAVDVAIRNVSSGPWTGLKGYVLVCESTVSPSGAKAQRDEFRFEVDVVEQAGPVGKDRTVRVKGKLTAPSWGGKWVLSCWMTHEGERFGDQADATIMVTGELDARITKFSADASQPPGKSSKVTVTAKNEGTRPWTPAEEFAVLVSAVSGPDAAEKVVEAYRVEIDVDSLVGPGESATFQGSLETPTWTGEYALEAWVTLDGDPFGDSEEAEVVVTRDLDAKIESLKLDGKADSVSLKVGRSYKGVARVSNRGDSAWNEHETYALRVVVEEMIAGSDQDPDEFDVLLPMPATPVFEAGKTWELKFNLKTPRRAGAWRLSFQMYDQVKKKPFGNPVELEVEVL